VNYTSYTVATNFGISGIHEFGATSEALVSSIVLPDGSQYTLNYEATPATPSSGACTPLANTYSHNCVTARLASITLPTGGTINYTYTNGNMTSPAANNGIVAADGSTPGLTRQTPDGTWTYARSQVSGAHYQTTINDPTTPTANQTIIDFQGLYETKRVTYQGSSSGTLLQTINTCYNGAASPCTTTAVTLPITRRTQLVAYPDNTGKVCEHDQYFNTYGLQTEQDDYDYGTGAPATTPLRKAITVYDTALTNGIVSMPNSITICNGSGTSSACTGPSGSSTGTVVAQTTYAYDQTTPTTSNPVSPQWLSVSGSRGNATTIQTLVSGSTFLTQTNTYYDTGNLNVATDVNGGTTIYSYTGTSCGNAFPTSLTEAISTLTQSYTWNCIGGVQTQLTDENGNNTITTYTDPYFWRPASLKDPTGATTNITYATSSPYNCAESVLSFNNGNSAADNITTIDGLGRTHVQQTRQAPGSSNFDSTETDYDALGRTSRATLPYVATSVGQTNSSAPGVSTTYDALNRTAQVSDSGTGVVTYSYPQNDVLISVGPAPTGENPKRRQLEYDSIGRLTSVCEITTILAGYGTCSQSSTQSGYWTKYTFDALGDLLTVTQNAQASSGNQQNRTYAYDAMGRLTSETNPESGTSNYTYDSDASCGSSSGDLMKFINAVGNMICFYRDALHRVTAKVIYNSPNSQGNVYFVYDTATVNGQAMQNGMGRLVEAFTAGSPTSSKITDEGFSYTARGEINNFYELTPHSSPAYYSIPQNFWPNGATNELSNNIATLPVFTYGVDGEGRPNTVSVGQGYGQNPVTSTSYNMYASPNQLTVTLGSGDSDVFSYDPNTMRMNKYQFKIATQTVTGTLGWNSNGSLGSLGIADPFSTANTQNCTFAADDLARISQASCGTIWGQNFTYDPFGNVQKTAITGTGATSFTPTYQSSPSITNRVASVGGVSATYDASGNSLNDTFRTLTWDTDSTPVAIGSVTLTHDALGRVVEQSVGSTNSEVVYSPAGVKFALMNGTTLTKAFVPLPGGATAVYTSSGLAYYRHTDHLGSSRFASTPSQTRYSDIAYSPFGEPYASSGAIDNSFTGQNQDTTAGLYDFLFREQDPNQSRWTSPDPAGLAAVDPTNPQSWNRYPYVQNNPLLLTDALGLTSGNDCNGGPCTPFTYQQGICNVSVTYSVGVGSDGQSYDVPSLSVSCGGGGGGSGNPDAPLLACGGFVAKPGCSPPPPPPPQINWGGNWPNCTQSVFNPSCKPPSCPAVFFSAGAEAIDPIPALPAGMQPHDVATAYASARATTHIIERGLVVPLRSSIVRDLLIGGEIAADTLIALPIIYAEVVGFRAEYKAWSSGTCGTIWSNP